MPECTKKGLRANTQAQQFFIPCSLFLVLYSQGHHLLELHRLPAAYFDLFAAFQFKQ
jgi:hypothetical protein